MMVSFEIYDDLLFEIYQYLPHSRIELINNVCKRNHIIYRRMLPYMIIIDYEKYATTNYWDEVDMRYQKLMIDNFLLIIKRIHSIKLFKKVYNRYMYKIQKEILDLQFMSGCMHIYKYMIRNYKPLNIYSIVDTNEDFIGCLPKWYEFAYQSNHERLIHYFMNKLLVSDYLNIPDNTDIIFEMVCDNGDLKLIKRLIKSNKKYISLNYGLSIACRGIIIYDNTGEQKNIPNMKLVKFFINRGATFCEWCICNVDKHNHKQYRAIRPILSYMRQ